MAGKKRFSKAEDMSVECPFCGKMFVYKLYPEITIPGDSKLKKQVLNKSLFFPECPHCGEQFKLRARSIYRDDNKKVWFIVTDVKDSEIETMMKNGGIGFNDIRTDDDAAGFLKGLYVRRVVYDVDSFREKILLSDGNYDDRIIELMKLSLSEQLEKQSGTPVYRIFLEETSGNKMDFTAIMGSHPPFEYVTIKTDTGVYNNYRKKYLNKLGRPEEDEYIVTDQNWAKESGLLKDEDAG